MTARTRANQLCAIGIGVNTMVSSPVLGTPAGRGVVAPNVDTLYSLAWLDVRGGPVVLSTPSITDRYYGFEFLDMYTDVFANVGARTDGGHAGSYAIVPPGWTGKLPAGIRVHTAPTWDVWMLGRLPGRRGAQLATRTGRTLPCLPAGLRPDARCPERHLAAAEHHPADLTPRATAGPKIDHGG